MENFETTPNADTAHSNVEKLRQEAPVLAKSLIHELTEGISSPDEQIAALRQWLDENKSNQETRAAFPIIAIETEKRVLERSTERQMAVYNASLAHYGMV